MEKYWNNLERQKIDCRRTKSDFTRIRDLMSSILAGWKAQIGRIVLIEYNISGIHLYTLSGIEVFNYIVNELDGIYRNFFWNNNVGSEHNQSPIP